MVFVSSFSFSMSRVNQALIQLMAFITMYNDNAIISTSQLSETERGLNCELEATSLTHSDNQFSSMNQKLSTIQQRI